ncbi:MAG TPA: phosphate ABC transporter substrate-binding protein [Solirubrobacteraceae bacterium]
MISKRITTRAVALAAVSAFALPAAALPAIAAAKPTITLSGSTTVAPLAALLIPRYLRACHHCAKFKLLQGGSNIGVSDVAHGRVSIGDSSRDPQNGDPGGLVFNPIARDAICLISNSANPIGSLSQTDVKSIFSGSVRSWSQVSGSAISGTIDLYTRNSASGTHDAFAKLIMGSTAVASFASQFSSNGLVEQAVQRDPHGIGYVSLHFGSGVHPISYQGVACTLRNAKSGQYPAVRNLYMVTLGNPHGAVGKFINWVRHSAAANAIVGTDWVPLH